MSFFIPDSVTAFSVHGYDLEPNVTFTPDDNWIVFRSNMHGERHVYMVSVEKETK